MRGGGGGGGLGLGFSWDSANLSLRYANLSNIMLGISNLLFDILLLQCDNQGRRNVSNVRGAESHEAPPWLAPSEKKFNFHDHLLSNMI